jgi:ribose 5-phosphate isomerase B
MRIAVAADELTGVAAAVLEELHERGHDTLPHGAEGRAEQAVVCCWTGTGASIAANKVPGIRAALCGDAVTAEGARRWNDANVLALSLRTTSRAELEEILDAWFAGAPSPEDDDRANVDHLAVLERDPS